NLLVWLFIGWEAMAQLAGEFRDPRRDLPRAMGLAFAVIVLVYAGLALATIVVPSGAASRVPLADLAGVSFGRLGRSVTAVVAVTLTMGTMNVYTGSSAKLAAALASERALPEWLGGDAHRSIPRRPLVVLAATSAILLAMLAATVTTPAGLVRATSACFLAVYVLSLGAAARILRGFLRAAAALALALTCVVAVFSSTYLVVPVIAAGAAVGFRWTAKRHRRPGRLLLERPSAGGPT
ncbi:MAG TPA: APC family permease, partial [Actinomycetota bacterium]|nr:APC family permease [Actinomycetota bacterium]